MEKEGEKGYDYSSVGMQARYAKMEKVIREI